MKYLTLILSIVLVALQQISGQVPQLFSYQAVLRNADGTVIASQAVDIRITLHKATADGTAVYTEVKNTTTTAQGVITLSIGDGTPATFATVPWTEKIFIQIELKKATETSYTSMGASQILSVPYSLYALSAGSVKEVISPTTAGVDDPIFVVKNKDGKIVFAVYQTGVRVYVEDTPTTKGAKGGFAVGGLSNQAKVGSEEYFRITSDSARIYINDLPGKGAKGGFAVGGLSNQAKAVNKDYFKVTQDTSFFKTTVYTQSNIISTGTVSTGAGTTSAPVTDLDGHTYQTVKIGSQIWMKENLQVTKYSNGELLSTLSEVAVYKQTTNLDTLKNYGRLYSESVVLSTKNVCPTGWHVPTDADWNELLVFVGGPDWQNSSITTGLKLMETGTVAGLNGFWNIPTNPGNNISGFSGRPGGEGEVSANWNFFMNLGTIGNWWSISSPTNTRYFSIDGNTGQISSLEGSNMFGYSVRCVKN